MKKVLMLMTILSFALKVAWAENTDVSQISNTIYIENFSVKVGEEKTVSVRMKNNFAPTGFQFDIVLPEGISIKTEDDFYCIDLSTARTTSRKTDTFSSARRSDGSVRVICSSTNNYTFSGNDGEVASIVFKVNANAKPGDYTLTLKNVELSEANGTAHPLGFDVKSTITVNANTESGKHIIASGECGENATWTLDDEGLLTIGGSGDMADYFSIAPWYDYRELIKEAVIENSVTSIGSHTFSHCPNLISISIPNSVSSISSWAFYECESLVAVTIPKSVNNIGYAPFTDCPKLVSLIVEDGNANYCSDDNVIFNKDKTHLICCACGKSGDYTIPSSVTDIWDYAFERRKNLSSITISNSVRNIGNYVFEGCEKIERISIPNSVTKIGAAFFAGCINLTSANISSSVTSIGIEPFRGCTKLTSLKVEDENPSFCAQDDVLFNKDKTLLICFAAGKRGDYIVPNTVTAIGDEAFYKCSGLSSITIPNTVKSIGGDAFSGCSGITSIIIPDGVTKIEGSMFSRCSNLQSVTIPESVESVSFDAFYECYSLADIINYATKPQRVSNSWLFNPATCNTNLHVRKGCGEAYANADVWKNFTIVEDATYATIIASGECGENATWTLDDEGLLTISGSGAMTDFSIMGTPWYSYKSPVISVKIENGITTVGEYAFFNCTGLTNITIPNSVISIGGDAFNGCSGLTNITIPNSVTSIGNSAFFDCSSLTNITIPSSVTSIGRYAFHGCSGLTNVNIPSSVTSIGRDAFYGCSGLTSITIPNSVTSIEDGTFNGCSSLINITIPNSVTSIGVSAFSGCSGLTAITIPSSVTSIGNCAFNYCPGLASIAVEDGNMVYDSRDNCNGIIKKNTNTLIAGCKKTLIPNSVASIGFSAFRGCSSLTNIVIPNSVTSIGSYAFSYCSGLTSLVVEDGNMVYDSRDNCNAIIETNTNSLVVGCRNSVITNSVTSIGGSAFYGCYDLTSITIPSSVTSIRNCAFYDCSGLISITIPNSVTSIEGGAFNGCSSLTDITIPNSVTSIGDYAFSGCSSLTNITIPSSVTSIVDHAFLFCRNLTSVTNYSTTPQQITSNTFSKYGTLHVVKGAGEAYANANYWKNFTIVEDATYATTIASGECGENATWMLDDEGLLSISGTGNMYNYDSWSPKAPWSDLRGAIKNVVIKEGITNVGSYSFYSCKQLESVELPNSVASINNYAFCDCNSLNTIELSSNVTALGDNCFYMCSSLSHVEIHSGLTSIGRGCFADCSSLQSIDVSVSNPSYISIDGVLFTKDEKIMIGYPAGKSAVSYSVPDGVEKLEYFCFKSCNNLQSIELPNSLNVLDWYCFEGCANLSNIVIPNSVTYIGYDCFHGCNSLKSIRIPSSVTNVREFGFSNCYNLESVSISDNMTFISNGCFSYCRSLSNVEIPEGIADITDYAFYGCSSLKAIELPRTLKAIGSQVFVGCPLESVISFASVPPTIDASAISTDCTLHVCKGCGAAYANADVWKDFTIVEDAIDPLNSDTDISKYDNIIYLDNMEVRPGQQAVLSFKMKNTAAIQTIGVYLELPEGMTVAEDDGDLLIELSTARTKASRHAISSNYVDEQYRIGILGTAGRAFEGTDGEVFTVTVDIDEKMAEGDYPIVLRHINLTDTNDMPYNTDYYKATISVVDITPGDANGDGSVNMTDANMVTNYFLGKINTAMKAKAADVNNDGSINMTDANMIVNMYLNQ